jgi:hypothetical protein
MWYNTRILFLSGSGEVSKSINDSFRNAGDKSLLIQFPKERKKVIVRNCCGH